MQQDADNNTILILLADLKPPTDPYFPSSDHDIVASALRMTRLYWERYRFIIDWQNASGKTALHVAALKGNEELVRVCGHVIANAALVLTVDWRCFVIWGQTST